MNSRSIVENVIQNGNGIAKVADMVNAGASRQEIKRLYSEGYLQRISQGYYQLASFPGLSEEEIITEVIPKAVVSMESALFYYGYSDFTPRIKSITVPRSSSRRIRNLSPVPLKIYYVTEELYELGKTSATENGVTFFIYDRERTICDLFKHRNKIDSEIFNKAIHAYVKDDLKNLKNLSAYAKRLRVYKKVTELMEVLLND